MVVCVVKEELRVVPPKNYYILGIVIVITILFLYYFYMWIDAYNETKLNRPIMDKYMEVINYNELSNQLIENPNTIVYVSILEDKQIRDFEKKFKSAYKRNEIKNEILYLNITEELKNEAVSSEMKSKYCMNYTDMTNVPVIIVFEGDSIRSIYSVKDNMYDIDKLKSFLDNIKYDYEDGLDG